MVPAPIVIFIYKRADHLDRTLASLQGCEGFAESPVIVYGDGPKTENERASVDAARRTAQVRLGSRAEYHFRERNAGLAASIICGVSETTRRFGRAIVLEDDLELSDYFLSYMNAGLDRYADADSVYQVSGQVFHTPEFVGRERALFLPFTSSWGWGTWRRAWERFDQDAAGWQLLAGDAALRRRFNLDGAYDFSTMLERQMTGHGDSWAIRWYWSVFRRDGITCFPPVSLVRNTGLDGSGTHGRGVLRRFKAQRELAKIKRIELPSTIAVDPVDLDCVKRALWRQNGGSLGTVTDLARRALFKITGRHM